MRPKRGSRPDGQGWQARVPIPESAPPHPRCSRDQGKGKRSARTTPSLHFSVRWSDGKVLEETYGGKSATAELSGLLPGMVKGLTGQTVGSRMLLVIPPADGYPDGNATPSLKPGETLVIVVDLLFTQSQ